MQCKHKKILSFLPTLLLSANTYSGGDILLNETHQAQTHIVSPWHFNFDTRYWFGSGKYTQNLYTTGSERASRLTFNESLINSAEAVWQLQHDNGIFVKGYLGGGSITQGHFIDQDFPMAVTAYSSTSSDQKNGALHYFTVDAGYDFLRHPKWKLGGFIGYHYLMEQYNAFGCRQTAIHPEICASPTISNAVNILSENLVWNSLRVGLNNSISLTNTVDLGTDLAYVRTNLYGIDYHNLRPDIRGLPLEGSGNGLQLDMLLRWAYSSNLEFGVGGRWWYIKTLGTAQFNQADVDYGTPQPIDTHLNTYGLLLQASYLFDEPSGHNSSSSLHNQEIFNWAGFYVGGNLGYGTQAQTVDTKTTNPFLPESLVLATPSTLNVTDAGFMVGVQLGYNWQIEHTILGLEGDFDYAHIASANAVTILPAELTSSFAKNIDWISSLRMRAGRLASDNMLVYLTGGLSFGEVSLAFSQNIEHVYYNNYSFMEKSQNNTKTGWSAGAGVEYAVTNHLAFKTEYLYLDLGTLGLNFHDPNSTMTAYRVATAFTNNLLRLGINYKF